MFFPPLNPLLRHNCCLSIQRAAHCYHRQNHDSYPFSAGPNFLLNKWIICTDIVNNDNSNSDWNQIRRIVIGIRVTI
jgi:hypothetical protein